MTDMQPLGRAVRAEEELKAGREVMVTRFEAGDTILESHTDKPVIRRLIDVYAEHEETVLALEEIDPARVNRYGIADASLINERTYLVSELVEKPSFDTVSSNLAIASRYILPPEIFPALEKTTPPRTARSG